MCGQGSCQNSLGSYDCLCPQGYTINMATLMCLPVGGYGCSVNPCNYGCTPTGSSNYMCGCPQGYHRIGQGHCVSTISTGSDLYGGSTADMREWPHVAAPSGQSGVPSGEGCYECDLDLGETGIPLQQPGIPLQQPRQRRSVQMMPESPLVVDVSNGNTVHSNTSTADVPKLRLPPPTAGPSTAPPLPPPTLPPATSHELPPQEPIHIYVHRNYTATNMTLLSILPTITLLNTEHCIISSADDNAMFILRKQETMTSLQLAMSVSVRGEYPIEITCKAEYSKDIAGSEVLDKTVIGINLHVV